MQRIFLSLFFAGIVAPHGFAQPGANPQVDAKLFDLFNPVMSGRAGDFPVGRNGLTVGVRICNTGTVNIGWSAAMNPDHPMYAFLVARENNGRFEQISDRSFLKHAFLSINGSRCGTCTTSGGSRLGPNCSDTYSSGTNANRFHLGPADEVDPWLGVWDVVGSHFDRGEPDVGPPQNADGLRSLTRSQVGAMNSVTHKIEVDDADLNVAGARYFFGAYVVIIDEPEAVREDNLIAREFAPAFSGGRWTFPAVTPPVNGSVLQHWSGVTLNSATNGADEGRFYVGVVVTGPDARGLWHYEYAVHNRDNSRGAATLRIPVCDTAQVLNVEFGDIDADAANDWAMSRNSGELVFLAGAANALEWNTIYNFAFDSDAAPTAGSVVLDQARPGAGAGDVAVVSEVPGAVVNQYLGAGCGAPAPTLAAVGTPAAATIPNPTFGLRLAGLQSGAAAVLLLGAQGGALPLAGGSGCVLYFGAAPDAAVTLQADPSGAAMAGLPIPDDPALEGADVFAQGAEVFAGGPAFQRFNLTNGIKVRVGSALTVCP
ncbi:MAG: hypothetical protein AAF628_06050 [Planctomycetota bacterium]